MPLERVRLIFHSDMCCEIYNFSFVMYSDKYNAIKPIFYTQIVQIRTYNIKNINSISANTKHIDFPSTK